MPYKTNSDLPESVSDHLPAHAQTIYREAFNSAWDQYDKPSERRNGDSREETSHQVAWAAVKKTYEKNDKTGDWVKSDQSGKSANSSKSDQSGKSSQTDKSGKTNKSDKSDKSGKSDKSSQSHRSAQPEKSASSK